MISGTVDGVNEKLGVQYVTGLILLRSDSDVVIN